MLRTLRCSLSTLVLSLLGFAGVVCAQTYERIADFPTDAYPNVLKVDSQGVVIEFRDRQRAPLETVRYAPDGTRTVVTNPLQLPTYEQLLARLSSGNIVVAMVERDGVGYALIQISADSKRMQIVAFSLAPLAIQQTVSFDNAVVDWDVRNGELGVLVLAPSPQSGLLAPQFRLFNSTFTQKEERWVSDLLVPGVVSPIERACFLQNTDAWNVALRFLGRARVVRASPNPSALSAVPMSCASEVQTIIDGRTVQITIVPEQYAFVSAYYYVDGKMQGLQDAAAASDHPSSIGARYYFDHGRWLYQIGFTQCVRSVLNANCEGPFRYSLFRMDVPQYVASVPKVEYVPPPIVYAPYADEYYDATLIATQAAAKPVWEIYNVFTGHFFYVMEGAEFTAITERGSAGAGWVKVGVPFRAWESGAQPSIAVPVCRFFRDGAYVGPRNTAAHFISANAGECANTAKNHPGWIYESPSVFWVLPADWENGGAAGTSPIYRYYNRREQFGDASHRLRPPDQYGSVFAGDADWQLEGIAWFGLR